MRRHVLLGGATAAAALGWLMFAGAPSRAADGAASGSTASATATALTVELARVQAIKWPQTIKTSGALAAWQEAIVSPETGGLRIAELAVEVGAHVKRGQLLARLADDSLINDLHKQEATVAQAQVTLDQATANVQRSRQVEGSGGLSAQTIEQYRFTEASAKASLASSKADLDATRLKLKQTRVIAPDDGIVSSRAGVLGNVVSAGTELYRLVRQGRVEWQAEVDARQLTQVQTGQRVQVTLPGGQAVTGRVRLVGPVLSTSTGRAIVYVSLPTDSPARVGMFASGTIELAEQVAQTLPVSAIVPRDGRDYVYVLGDGNKVRSMPVQSGRRQGQRVEVLSGLPADARVVASGGAFLSDGAVVAVKAAAGQ